MVTADFTFETLLDAVKFFADPHVSRDFLAQLRWPDGAVCPRCAEKLFYIDEQIGTIGTCPSCGEKFTLPANEAKTIWTIVWGTIKTVALIVWKAG